MKVMLFSFLTVFAFEAQAATLHATGATPPCNTEQDINAVQMAFDLANPVITLEKDILTLKVDYKFFRCQKVGGKIGFYLEPLTNPDQRLLIIEPKTKNRRIGHWNKKGTGTATMKLAVSSMLSMAEMEAYKKGESITKTINLYNGSPSFKNADDFPMNYSRSGGEYALDGVTFKRPEGPTKEVQEYYGPTSESNDSAQ